MTDARRGRGRGAMNFKAYRKGYDLAFGLCKNSKCPLRYNCYRYIATPLFNSTFGDFKPVNGVCEFYQECKTKTDFDELENEW